MILSPWPVVDTAPILSSAYPPHPAIETPNFNNEE
jgi:hypothetical protein